MSRNARMTSYQLPVTELIAFLRNHRHELAQLATVLEQDRARHLGKQRVVFAAPYVEAGLQRCPALPHNDGAARHELPAKRLDAKPLRIRIAAVSRTA